LSDANDLSTIKLCDFGLSAQYDINSNFALSQWCGTLVYMAPELCNER